jgi:polyhydroxyalkanoate synthesis regulator phasin
MYCDAYPYDIPEKPLVFATNAEFFTVRHDTVSAEIGALLQRAWRHALVSHPLFTANLRIILHNEMAFVQAWSASAADQLAHGRDELLRDIEMSREIEQARSRIDSFISSSPSSLAALEILADAANTARDLIPAALRHECDTLRRELAAVEERYEQQSNYLIEARKRSDERQRLWKRECRQLRRQVGIAETFSSGSDEPAPLTPRAADDEVTRPKAQSSESSFDEYGGNIFDNTPFYAQDDSVVVPAAVPTAAPTVVPSPGATANVATDAVETVNIGTQVMLVSTDDIERLLLTIFGTNDVALVHQEAADLPTFALHDSTIATPMVEGTRIAFLERVIVLQRAAIVTLERVAADNTATLRSSARLASTATQIRTLMESSNSEYRKGLDDVIHGLQQLQTAATSLPSARLQTLADTLTTASNVQAAETELTTVRLALAQAQNKATELDTDNNQLRLQATATQRDASESARQLTTSQDRVAELTLELAGSITELSGAREQARTLLAELSDAREQTKTLSTELGVTREQRQALSTTVDELRQELAALKEAHSALKEESAAAAAAATATPTPLFGAPLSEVDAIEFPMRIVNMYSNDPTMTTWLRGLFLARCHTPFPNATLLQALITSVTSLASVPSAPTPTLALFEEWTAAPMTPSTYTSVSGPPSTVTVHSYNTQLSSVDPLANSSLLGTSHSHSFVDAQPEARSSTGPTGAMPVHSQTPQFPLP